MSEPSKEDLALALTVLKYVQEEVTPVIRGLRAQANEKLAPGDRIVAVNPTDNTVIGSITKDTPQAKAEVTDDAALHQWVQDNYSEFLEKQVEVTGSHDEVVAVLTEHAPHLVDERLRLPDWKLNELLRASAQAGRPVGPGGELDIPGIQLSTPDSRVSTRLKPGAPEAVPGLIRAGRVSLDGTVHNELPPGSESS